ncbi:MAG: acyloxyacyl hydrolase [Verrucomicrobiota bacterium]|nr:acyloxyacyl hydrolase [Verrucomicrobiota bacterium]
MKLTCLFACILSVSTALGGEPGAAGSYREASDAPFSGGRMELQLVAGVIGSPIFFGPHQISYTFVDSELRLGWMLNSPRGSGWLRGNFEVLGAFTGGMIARGPGEKFGTTDVFIRYNFVQPNARIVPYAQFGAGVFISDIADDPRQGTIGSTYEADLRAAAGLHYFFSPRWSFDAEAFVQHVSNAGTADRNVGINAIGGVVGIARMF